jgi:hypothetical protein
VTAARIVPVNNAAVKLVGYALWRGGKWYLRRRLPSTRVLALRGFAGLFVLVAVAILMRRLGS